MHLAVTPTGFIQPCCRFKIGEHSEHFSNIKDSSLTDGRMSDGFRAVENAFKNNSFPAGCSSCRIEEENGITSMRQNSIKKFSHLKELSSIEFYLGNTCNMKCRSCSPLYSSRWEQEGAHFGFPSFERPKVDSARMLKEMDIQNLKYLKLLGGEPFYINSFYEIIDTLVERGVAPSLTLDLSSNVSIFPEPAVIDQLRLFKGVQLSLSIDDIGKRAEYLRSGTNWRVVSQNLGKWFELQKSAANFDISVHITVSAYNVLHLDSIVLFLLRVGWSDITLMTIKDPTELSPLRIPFQKRQQAWARMQETLAAVVAPQLTQCIEKIVLFPKELPTEEFYAYNHKMDAFRGESLTAFWNDAP